MPVDYMRGNLSGRQELTYNDKTAYDGVCTGSEVAAAGYQPRLVAKVMRNFRPDRLLYFQVRTKSSVNMTASMRHNLALMGASGALFAALISDKSALIYAQCVAACPRAQTLRAFIVPIFRAGLDDKVAAFTIADGVTITNPWRSTGAQTLTIRQAIIDKFNDELS